MPENRGDLDQAIRLLSHQLKSPLDAIRSLLDGVVHGLPEELTPRVAQLLSRAARRAEEARDLIGDLLDFQALGETASLRLQPLDAAALVAGVAADYVPQAADKGISLETALPEGTEAWILGDARTLEQALCNLVDNALKYTPRDGSVAIRLEPNEREHKLTLRVSDTGPGIDPNELPSLFEPFFRSARLRSAVPGTGLGLALARRIATAHTGSLTAESTPGMGSVFTLTLPLERLQQSSGGAAKRRRVVIVGGVTAGPKTAARLRRLDPDAQITMIERSEFLSYTGCGLPAYVGGKMDSPRDLMSTTDATLRSVRFFQTIKDVRVLARTVVTDIDRAARTVSCRDLTTDRAFTVPYDALVLATGTRVRPPSVPGMDLPGIYSLYGLEGARELRTRLKSQDSQDVCVIGAGHIGVSLAESLVDAGARVTLLEREPVILSGYLDSEMAERIRRVLARRGVKVLTSSEITQIRRQGEQLVLATPNRTHVVDAVVLATGVVPESDLARKAGLELGVWGGIKVDEHLRTSDEHIWAAGDCAESVNLITGLPESLPLGSVSTRMGRIAADSIVGRPVSFRGSLGTSMVRVFGVNAARTGLTHARATSRGMDAVSATVVGLDRPHYVDTTARMAIKVTADRSSGRILGAQGVGPGNVVTRIQILAAAMTRGATLEDLVGTDLGYHPAFTTPIDLAQTACMVLQAKIEGLVRTLEPDDLTKGRYSVVDVSPYTAQGRPSAAGSVNVPLESLRREGIPFARDAEVVLCDATSAGAYEAYRILLGKGWTRLWVLEGGAEELA